MSAGENLGHAKDCCRARKGLRATLTSTVTVTSRVPSYSREEMVRDKRGGPKAGHQRMPRRLCGFTPLIRTSLPVPDLSVSDAHVLGQNLDWEGTKNVG